VPLRVVSPFLKRVIYPLVASTGYLRRHLGMGPAVVTYHGILPRNYRSVDLALDGGVVRSDVFCRQIRWLIAHYKLISPRELLAWLRGEEQLPPASVMLTCDDGLQNTLSLMLGLLKENDVSCLFFVTGESANEKNEMLWYEELYLMFLDARSFSLKLP